MVCEKAQREFLNPASERTEECDGVPMLRQSFKDRHGSGKTLVFCPNSGKNGNVRATTENSRSTFQLTSGKTYFATWNLMINGLQKY